MSAHTTRTRIIATVGPACARKATLYDMIRAGVGVFRFNFSHGTLADHERMLERIWDVRRGGGHKVEILQDLAGHRIRTGRLKGGGPVTLKTGQHFMFYRKPVPGTSAGTSMDYPGSFHQIHPHQMIFVDDRRQNVDNMEAAFQGSPVPATIFRYGAADSRVKAFNPAVADREWSVFANEGRLLSDEEAAAL